jgi:Mg-chelatase subunit ChlD
MKALLLIIVLFVVAAVPSELRSATLTQQEVIELLQLKTPEAEIIEQIKAGGTTFTLGAEDIARLKRLGATPGVLAAMQGAGARGVDLTTAEISDLCLVVDYSGSMNEKTPDGVTKMSAAKQAVGKLIDAIPENVNVAVVVYGCDKSRGCDDIDLLQPLGPMDKAALKSKIMGLPNTGMTPIGASLNIAGKALKKASGGRAIVLVTDGVESCQGNPSGVATKLAAEFGVKFGLHVVGFDIKPAERASLEAIATAGHGKFFNAANADELAKAMQKVTEQVATAPKQRATTQYAASGQATKGGVWFDDAPPVQAGEYKGDLRFREARYYQVPVTKGQTLTAVAIIKKTPIVDAGGAGRIQQDFYLTIYAPSLAAGDRQKIKTEDNPQSPVSLRSSWTADEDGMAFVCVSASANYFHVMEEGLKTPPAPSPYSLKIRLEGEGGSAAPAAANVQKVRAGSNFETAGQMSGSGLVAEDLKYGESAYFSVPSQKGDVLEVSIAGQKPVEQKGSMAGKIAHYDLVAYDDDQVQVGKKSFKITGNLPDAASETLSIPVALTGKTYVAVSIRKLDTDEDPAPGRLAVLIRKQGESGPSETGGASADRPKSKDAFSGAEGKSK